MQSQIQENYTENLSSSVLRWLLIGFTVIIAVVVLIAYLDMQKVFEEKHQQMDETIHVLTPDFIKISMQEEMEDAVHLTRQVDQLTKLNKMVLKDPDGRTLFYYQRPQALTHQDAFFVPFGNVTTAQKGIELDGFLFAVVETEFSNEAEIKYFHDLLKISTVLIVGFLLLLFLLKRKLATKVVMPIKQLSQTFSDFGKTYQLDQPIVTAEKNEIGHLYSSFSSMAQELGELKTDLEAQVVRRTEALEKAKLRAEEAEQARSMFLANMSHELRTPINGILGFADLLKEVESEAERDRYIETIRSSSRHLLAIVNDILDISKIEKGEIELNIQPEQTFVDLDKMLLTFKPTADQKNIKYEIQLCPTLPECLSYDSLRVHQVLNNLLSNAMKFTPEQGTVSITIDKVKEEGKTVDVIFSVKDSGIGIPKEKQEQVFESFKQTDSSTSKQFGGTGLGLSISNQLVQRMGGDRIHLDSEPGQGACFSFTLPLEVCEPEISISNLFKKSKLGVLKQDDSDATYLLNYLQQLNVSYEADALRVCQCESTQGDCVFDAILVVSNQVFDDVCKTVDPTTLFVFFEHPPETVANLKNVVYVEDFELNNSALYNTLLEYFTAREEPSKQDKSFIFNQRVLLAEDNIVNQTLMKAIFNKLNIDADIANNGQEAVELYQQGDYGLVLMDINMPVMDGPSALQALQSWAESANQTLCPVVALTANVMSEQVQEYEALGFYAHLAKPLEVTRLTSLFEELKSS